MRVISSLLCLAFLLATDASAQLASQTALVGTVTDSADLVVPGAQVVAVNTGTKDTYEATTNADGYYSIQFVRSGTYDITITLAGFQTFKATGVEVGNNQVIRTNAVMKVGALDESVSVEAKAQVLNTDSAVVSETIGQRAVVDLPVSGRNVWSLASTTPGVLGGLNSDIGLSFRGAGQREIQNSLSLDGINSSSNLLAATSMRPIADAVTEIQVQTGSTSAEYGSYLGVHINVVTKSGTNDLARLALRVLPGRRPRRARLLREPRQPEESAAPQPVRIRRWTARSSSRSSTTAATRRSSWAAYEGVRGEAMSSPFASVPTALMRQGNFSEISDRRSGIRSPGQPFPGNIIPPSHAVADRR